MFLCVCLTVATIQALPVIILLGDSVPMLGDNTLIQNYIQDLNILNSDESKMELQNDGSILFEDDLEVEIENSKDKTLLLNKGSEDQAQVKKISKEGVFSHFKTD